MLSGVSGHDIPADAADWLGRTAHFCFGGVLLSAVDPDDKVAGFALESLETARCLDFWLSSSFSRIPLGLVWINPVELSLNHIDWKQKINMEKKKLNTHIETKKCYCIYEGTQIELAQNSSFCKTHPATIVISKEWKSGSFSHNSFSQGIFGFLTWIAKDNEQCNNNY